MIKIIIAISNNSFLFKYMLKCNLFLWCAAEFSEIIILFSVTWFSAQETFLIIVNVENCAASYFCGNCDTFYFSGFFDELKEQQLFEI